MAFTKMIGIENTPLGLLNGLLKFKGKPQIPADFFKAVLELRTTLEPRELLGALLAIEREHGRERPYRNAPRTLDLDLLLYGGRCIDEPGLVVPHPRMHLRAFVLDPLAEIAPRLAHPVLGPLAVWRERITDQPIERLT